MGIKGNLHRDDAQEVGGDGEPASRLKGQEQNR
jgi:hypothetical protein